MLNRIIVLSGPISSGKSTLANGLAEKYGMAVFKTSEILKKKVKKSLSSDRITLQKEGERVDKKTKGRWIAEELGRWESQAKYPSGVIIDSARIIEQIQAIREAYGSSVIHVHLTAPEEALKRRFDERQKLGKDQNVNFTEMKLNRTEKRIEELAKFADVVINTKRCNESDVLARTTSHLNIRVGKGTAYVDVVVGGQFGSEGKGQVVAYLAKEYDMFVRVGGPNAGHSVFEEPEPYHHHQLPSGTRRNPDAKLLIGPGAVLNVEKLLQEISECEVDNKRLCIDNNAMIIIPEDVKNEENLVKNIGSTGQGVGVATVRRIMRDKGTVLAKDVPELKPFIGDTLDVLENAYLTNKRILLEGTQGTGLSLYHGIYPYVTSRDTTVQGCISESGIPSNRVRKVIMVCRTYPIRVESPKNETSGPLRELSWEEIAIRSGYPVDALLEAEKTTTTHRQRRIGEFDWAIVHRAALLNGATDIALTFTDYLSNKNRKAMRLEQLTQETISFIQELEHVTGAPVSLISTGFNHRSIIDRRNW
jgi:adenylosuccinate synthase